MILPDSEGVENTPLPPSQSAHGSSSECGHEPHSNFHNSPSAVPPGRAPRRSGPRHHGRKKHRQPEISEVLARLDGVRECGNGWISRCPAHCDERPSLSIGLGDYDRILLYCHAGCTFDKIVEALELEAYQLSRRLAGYFQSERTRAPPNEPPPAVELERLAIEVAAQTSVHDLSFLARDVSLPVWPLRELQIGWSLRDNCWTIPERRCDGRIVGVQRRFLNGTKRMYLGSHRGLVIPNNLSRLSGELFIAEGATDTAALLAAGLGAIGRPACGICPPLHGLLTTLPITRIVVVADNDPSQSDRSSGLAGAQRCARAIAAYASQQVTVVRPPRAFKDVRDFIVSQTTQFVLR